MIKKSDIISIEKQTTKPLLNPIDLIFSKTIDEKEFYKLISCKSNLFPKVLTMKIFEIKKTIPENKVLQEIDFFEKLRENNLNPIIFPKYYGFFKTFNNSSGTIEYNLIFEEINDFLRNQLNAENKNNKLKWSEIKNFHRNLVLGLCFLKNKNIDIDTFTIDDFGILKSKIFQKYLLINIIDYKENNNLDFKFNQKLDKFVIVLIKNVFDFVLGEKSRKTDPKENLKEFNLKIKENLDEKERNDFENISRLYDKCINGNGIKYYDILKFLKNEVIFENSKFLENHILLESGYELNFTEKTNETYSNFFMIKSNDGNTKIFGYGSNKIDESYKSEKELLLIIEKIKNILSLNVQIQKIDQKKEVFLNLFNHYKKLNIVNLNLQAIPSQKLVGNDPFFKFLYEHFYFFDINEQTVYNGINYHQEHDGNWYNGINEVQAELYLDLLDQFEYKFDNLQILKISLISWNSINANLISKMYQKFDCLNFSKLIELNISIEGSSIDSVSLSFLIKTISSKFKKLGNEGNLLNKLSLNFYTSKNQNDLINDIVDLLENLPKLKNLSLFLREITKKASFQKFDDLFKSKYFCQLNSLTIGFLGYSIGPNLNDENLCDFFKNFTTENFKNLLNLSVCLCSYNGEFTNSLNHIIGFTQNHAFDYFNIYISQHADSKTSQKDCENLKKKIDDNLRNLNPQVRKELYFYLRK